MSSAVYIVSIPYNIHGGKVEGVFFFVQLYNTIEQVGWKFCTIHRGAGGWVERYNTIHRGAGGKIQ